jgi:hypothetical protein
VDDSLNLPDKLPADTKHQKVKKQPTKHSYGKTQSTRDRPKK